jgi:RES domain-containing protein
LSRSLWRIATDTPAYEADDLSGRGAELTGGRWNAKGVPVVHASETRALACLETVVHLNAAALPLNRYLVEIVVPDEVWRAADASPADAPPVGWDARPFGRASLEVGKVWVRAGACALLIAPSVIVPEERNVLINPRHPDSRRLSARKVRLWTYDRRLGKAG